jgi:hypothetical protein
VQLAHAEEGLADGLCHPLKNVMTLEQQAAAYRAMHISGVTSTVITSWMSQSTVHCKQPYEMASWNEMLGLQHNDGWTFVSGSIDGQNLVMMPAAAAHTEICQSGQIIAQEGLTGGYGEFAFPISHTDTQLEQVALSCGYAFGRVYNLPNNSVPVAKPYWLGTYSLNGGACADTTKACYHLPTRFHYTDPAVLVSLGRQDPGHWRVIQGYAFVTGAVTASTASWDCTSPNWQDHWSSGPDASEIYCSSDWMAALKTYQGVQFVTPEQMRSLRQP